MNTASARFHHFPKDLTRRQSWVDATPLKDFGIDAVKDDTYLCHLHFDPSAYFPVKVDQRNSRGSESQRAILKPGAVPQIWPNCPYYLTRPCIEQRPTSLATAEARSKTEQIEDEKEPMDEDGEPTGIQTFYHYL